MKKNMETIDKVVRVIIALVVLVLFLTDVISGTLGIILLILAGIFVLTSLVSFCPLYAPFGIVPAAGNFFDAVLRGLGEEKVARLLFAINEDEKETIVDTSGEEKLVQALSIYFQLMNLVSENAAVQFRRKLENRLGADSIRGSWAETFSKWRQSGLSQQQIADILPNIHLMPVLTAHPTEAKRVSILELHRELYLLLVKKENIIWSETERNVIDELYHAMLERWWRSGEVYLEKPDVASERSAVMHYFTKVFPEALAMSDKRLKFVWELNGFDPVTMKDPDNYPLITFGSWIGGDRDGHPYVTAEVTRETLGIHRQAALDILEQQLIALAKTLSFSYYRNEVPETFITRIVEISEQIGKKGEQAFKRNPHEPWRQYINLMLMKLTNSREQDGCPGNACYYLYPDKQKDYPYEALNCLATLSLDKYQQLIQHPRFIEYFSQCTPIDVVERSKIGSRPARRTGERTLADLRAIPWVFSWNQSRYNITAWYGVGYGLEIMQQLHPALYDQLKKHANNWLFLRYMLIQIETNLLNADPLMMRSYASLVKDDDLRIELLSNIMQELKRSIGQVATLLGGKTETRRTSLIENVHRRRNPLHILHKMHIEKLHEWREIEDKSTEEAEILLNKLLVITTAISGGTKSTG